MKHSDLEYLILHCESAHDVDFYNIAGQRYFAIYGASGGLAADLLAYIKPASCEWKLPADDMGTCADSPGFKVKQIDGIPFLTVRWPSQQDPAELFLKAIIAMKQQVSCLHRLD